MPLHLAWELQITGLLQSSRLGLHLWSQFCSKNLKRPTCRAALSLLIQLIKAHRLGYKLYIILVLVDCTMLLLFGKYKKYKTADIFYTAYSPFSGLAMKHEVMLFCNYFIINPPSLGLIITVYFLL